jgi:thioredoxin-related protein
MTMGTVLFALSGAEVFEKKCASCHDYYIPQSRLNTNYEYNNTDLKLKAPTLTELSFRLKDQVGDRTTDAEGQKFEIEVFLTVFLKDPASNKKSILKKQTRKVFGEMPPVEVDEDEVEALADFMYDYAEQMMVKHGVKRYSYEEALKKAKAEGKIVLIEGYIPFCRGCIRMDRNVMVESRVKEALNRDFVLVKMNLLIEKLPLGMKRLGTPSFYFIDKRGKKILEMVEGTGTVEEFLALLERVRLKVSP